MLSISLSKKTFGIENNIVLNLAVILMRFLLMMLLVSVFMLSLLTIIVALKYSEPQLSVPFLADAHFFVSTLISSLTGLYTCSVEERLTRKQSIRIGFVTIFHFIYLFILWIAKYQVDVSFTHSTFQHSIGFHHAYFFFCLVITVFFGWRPWENQSRWEELEYEVIYGGNDTKKMPVDSEA